jgi:hypothetical protein
LNEPETICRRDSKGVQSLKGVPGKAVTRFGKSSLRDAAMKSSVTAQATKEGIKHDLF